MPDWILSWILIGLTIWPLIQVERWIHKHIQGLGLLLTNNPQAAVLIYYLLLLPGVALHELSQWLLAKALGVRVKKFRLWPEKQRGGIIRLGLVEIDPKTDTIRATLVGMVPLATGLAAIALIGSTHFNTDVLLDSLLTGDLPTIIAGLNAFVSAPDFWLWVYLVFAIANAMLPEPHDRISWPLLGGTIAAIVIFLLVLDLNILLQTWVQGPLAQLARWVSLALLIALTIDVICMMLIAGMEWLFSRILNRELEYR
ncbi:MAG TPA: hypothetical protein ENI95_08590 [Chloroflexi bacterium]|nr:hypothetical protein [Chloroflexota bacterium]